MKEIQDFISETLGLSLDTQTKIIFSLVVVFILWMLKVIIQRIVWRQTDNIKTRYQWKRSLSLAFPFVGVFIISAIWISAFKQFGTFLGLFSAGLAFALRDPLTNLAGWFFIVFRKPFVVGDRVQVGDDAGDVIDIRLFQFTILEIGNWVDADQSTGRIIHLPNGKVFQQSQANYSTGFEYIWNEIPVRISFESNWEKAKQILKSIADKHAEHLSSDAEKEIFEASKNFMIYYKYLTPIVYTSVKENGVQITMRYLCNPRNRRGSENEIWEHILGEFQHHEDIQFAYPTTRFYTRAEDVLS